MITITDLTLISEILNVVVIPAAAIFAVKIKQYKPQIEEAVSQKNEAVEIAETIYQKSSSALLVFEKLKKLSYDYNNAAASGDISNEEAQTLLADVKVIADDPAVKELQTLLEGYTCSRQ